MSVISRGTEGSVRGTEGSVRGTEVTLGEMGGTERAGLPLEASNAIGLIL